MPVKGKVKLSQELPQTKEETTIKENEVLDKTHRIYMVYELPQKSFLRQKYGIDRIRIYDKDIMPILRYGNMIFAKEKGRLIREGEAITVYEQRKIAEENGWWTDEDEKELEQLSEIVQERLRALEYAVAEHQEADENDRPKLGEEVDKRNEELTEAMDKYYRKLTIKTNIFGHTVEFIALERQKLAFLAAAVCYDEGDDRYDPEKRIWKTVEDLENGDFRLEDLSDLIFTAESYWNSGGNLENPFFGGSPEGRT